METEAPSKKKKGSKRQDVESSRLSNKRKKVYTSFGPQPQTRGNPTPPAPQTEKPPTHCFATAVPFRRLRGQIYLAATSFEPDRSLSPSPRRLPSEFDF
ncbi:hypothetical protein U1Q18_026128 [Sarracenia purpurea var. burkii]